MKIRAKLREFSEDAKIRIENQWIYEWQLKMCEEEKIDLKECIARCQTETKYILGVKICRALADCIVESWNTEEIFNDLEKNMTEEEWAEYQSAGGRQALHDQLKEELKHPIKKIRQRRVKV